MLDGMIGVSIGMGFGTPALAFARGLILPCDIGVGHIGLGSMGARSIGFCGVAFPHVLS